MSHAPERTTIWSPATLRATIYAFTLPVPPFAHSPLESASPFATSSFHGGLASIQVIRYASSAAPLNAAPTSHLRVTRIYAQTGTSRNTSRASSSRPRRPAPGAMAVKVFPYDTSPGDEGQEAAPAARPFFEATFKPMGYLPRFLLSSKVARWVGVDLRLVQPPLPQGKGGEGVLVGTRRWCAVEPRLGSRKACLGWWDLRQEEREGEEGGGIVGRRTGGRRWGGGRWGEDGGCDGGVWGGGVLGLGGRYGDGGFGGRKVGEERRCVIWERR
ncbi:hypothetical protein MMC13_000023 [Lambiella insularis]|nr:hypothetical protein [Lambiella insularis]